MQQHTNKIKTARLYEAALSSPAQKRFLSPFPPKWPYNRHRVSKAISQQLKPIDLVNDGYIAVLEKVVVNVWLEENRMIRSDEVYLSSLAVR
ncbi:hypothetical protein [Rhizobium sp.]|jgi:hypothetical protein|uniref:hypothetical protein n=1 Tax=Rhizobium sp. TaxID=391 RepID=UPI002AA821E6